MDILQKLENELKEKKRMRDQETLEWKQSILEVIKDADQREKLDNFIDARNERYEFDDLLLMAEKQLDLDLTNDAAFYRGKNQKLKDEESKKEKLFWDSFPPQEAMPHRKDLMRQSRVATFHKGGHTKHRRLPRKFSSHRIKCK
jgi:hypothetical protein